MEKDKKDNNLNSKSTNEKLERMRKSVLDKEKCKEIAKRLTQYISNS